MVAQSLLEWTLRLLQNAVDVDGWTFLSRFSDWVSLLTAGIGLKVLWEVRKVRRSFLFHARFPEWLKSLRKLNSDLTTLLAGSVTAEAGELHLRKCRALLESLSRGSHGPTQINAKVLSESVSLILANGNCGTHSEVQKLYFKLMEFETQLQELEKDKRTLPPV